jgi:Ca-activated chloride channel family protein
VTHLRVLALVVALACCVAACTHDSQPVGTVQLANPGRCTPVDVAAAPETAPLLTPLAQQFNASPASHLTPSSCVFVRVAPVDSSRAADRLVADWPDPGSDGAAPAVWAPASSAWVTLANSRRSAAHLDAIATTGESFARTPLVVAMLAPVAHALGWPARPVSWHQLSELAASPLGWAVYGHPEWGAFRLGKASPELSTSALLQTMAVTPMTDGTAGALEASVTSYGDASWPFLGNWQRLDGHRSEYTYLSAAITDERAVTAYNDGSGNGVVPDKNADLKKPKVPLVGVVPTGATPLESDNPLVVLNASWVSDTARDGARAFVSFALSPDAQRTVVAAGFRPGGPHTDLANPAYRTASTALTAWTAIRKKARVLILFDVSDSMGDPADPVVPNGPTKIGLAKAALLAALDRLAPDDEVGLRIFTSNITSGPSPSWQDVVPVGELSKQRTVLTHAINGLEPRDGSPLYTAIHDTYDAMAKRIDPTRINGIVLLTDGFNEDDSNNDRKALLAHLHDNIRIFPIGYSGDADMGTLALVGNATNTRIYDATNTSAIDEVLPAALSNF